MPSRGSHRLLAGLLAGLVLTGASSCSDEPDAAPSPGRGSPTAVETTERALAAAVEEHLGRDAAAAAPLFRGDGLPRGAIGTELAFDRAVGDNTHVRVVVSPPGADPQVEDLTDCSGFAEGCEEDVVNGTAYVLLREAGSPEEDPGYVGAVGRRDDVAVFVLAYGPLVPGEEGEGEADDVEQTEELVDLVRAVVTDPAVGLRTSAAYDEAGRAIPDDRWLDWFGQGNGASEPEGYRPT